MAAACTSTSIVDTEVKAGSSDGRPEVETGYMGSGPYPTVSLAKARQKAITCRAAVQDGRDPIAERRREAEPTFGKCAEKCIASLDSGWRSAEHRRQWKQTISVYCKPILDRRVSQVSTEEDLRSWSRCGQRGMSPAPVFATGSRSSWTMDVRMAGGRPRTRPARRGHLNKLLPKPPKLQRAHHRAMPYGQIGAFLDRLRPVRRCRHGRCSWSC